MDDDLLWNIAWMTPAICGAAVIVFMVYVLIGYMVVEIRAMMRIRRRNQGHDQKVNRARRQIESRERRLAKEKLVREAEDAGEALYYEQIKEIFQNGVE